jgi:hypothetical protein
VLLAGDLYFSGRIPFVGNADGKLGNVVIENSALGNGPVRVQIIFDNTQSPVTSSLTIRSSY